MKRGFVWLIFAGLALAAWGGLRLRFDADALNLLPADLPAVRGLQWHQQHFAGSQELLITLTGDDADALLGKARAMVDRLRARPDLVRSAHAVPPWLERPADGAENLAWLWLQRPPAEFQALVERLAPDALNRQLAETREVLASSLDPSALARASYDPIHLSHIPGANSPPGAGMDDGVGSFQDATGTFRLIHVEPAVAGLSYRATAAWLAEVRREIQSIPNPPALSFTGGPVFLSEIAAGMERDMTSSVLTTLIVIAVLFWLAHRSLRPLLGLVLALAVTLAGTLALGGLVFGTLNVISAGFAAVLLGLVVDYGLVGYQEARAHPELSLADIRRRAGPGIAWSAVTTAGTFAMLRWAGLPGLAQLGTLTALGLLLGAGVMTYGFLPLAVRGIRKTPYSAVAPARIDPGAVHRHVQWGLLATLGLLLAALAVWIRCGWPATTGATAPLRPRQSPAYDAMEALRSRLGRTNDPIWLLCPGDSPEAVAKTMADADAVLSRSRARGEITSYALPRDFWPRPDHARKNLALATAFAGAAERLRSAASTAGFTPDSLRFDEAVLASWSRWAATPGPGPLWPTNSTSAWIHRQFAARTVQGEWLALGLVDPGTRTFLGGELPSEVVVSGWDPLGPALLERVSERVLWLTGFILLFIATSLWLAFRRWTEVGLGLAALVMALGLLLSLMSALGATWNLLSLVAIPLVLGSSVDSTIHVQLALRRGGGWSELWRTTGRALVLCAGANIAGFGSLAWSNNAGLASLDVVCAGGVFCVLLVALGLLPAWWWATAGRLPSAVGGAICPSGDAQKLVPGKTAPPAAESRHASVLYNSLIWRAGGVLVRVMPRTVALRLAPIFALAYRCWNPDRARTVEENLRPLTGNSAAAAQLMRRNFVEFARKIVDLWRFEAGADVSRLVRPGSGWEHFRTAQAQGRGILLVTPHLGNWEFGALLLRQNGVRPLVLTAREPGNGFTELRAAARARQAIDTLVVGADPFAFIEVIRRLQSGGVVAVLLDRPAASTAVTVEFFGRPFAASVAAAELARAADCILLPTYIVRDGDGYCAHLLPPVPCDRRRLGQRAERVAWTGEILRAFEPVLRQYPDQWFHFVPVWSCPTGQEANPNV